MQDLLQAMAQERQADREQITQLLAQITALTAAGLVIPSIERDTPSSKSTTTDAGRSNNTKYSKKRPDPPVLTDGVDPIFES